jgi:LPS-assembly lipoprotein
MLGVVPALAGCGFHPVYAPSSGATPSVAAQLDEIQIGLIPNRSGQLLHEALEADLRRAGAPVFFRYHLHVNYGISAQVIGLQPDSSSSRTRLFANASCQLTKAGEPSQVVTKGSASTMDAVNVVDNQYFALSLSNDQAHHQLARAIAEQITLELATYFNAHPHGG